MKKYLPLFLLLGCSTLTGGSDYPDRWWKADPIPAKSWEEIGKEPATPLWAMVESVYGKPEAQSMRKSLNDAVQEQNSHVDSYNTDLTYKASGK